MERTSRLPTLIKIRRYVQLCSRIQTLQTVSPLFAYPMNWWQILLSKLGLQVPDFWTGDAPQDEYTVKRSELETLRASTASNKPPDKLKQFLENDGKVLRFFAIWDDRAHPYGDLRKFVSRAHCPGSS